MKAVNKGAPYMAAQQKKVQSIQQDAVDRVMNPAAEAEKVRQKQMQGTILGSAGGGDKL